MKCCIIGLGVFGKTLARDLAQMGADILAIDRREENVSLIKDEVGAALVMDFKEASVLDSLPIREMDVVIMAIGDDFENSMQLTVKAMELGAKRIVCRVLSPMHERLLRLLKVDRLVVPEEVAARGLAHSLLMRGVVDGFDMGNGYSVIEVRVPAQLVGMCLLEKAGPIFKKAEVRIVTIKRCMKPLLKLPKPARGRKPPADPATATPPDAERRRTLGVVKLEEAFQEDDIFVLFGREKKLRDFLEQYA